MQIYTEHLSDLFLVCKCVLPHIWQMRFHKFLLLKEPLALLLVRLSVHSPHKVRLQRSQSLHQSTNYVSWFPQSANSVSLQAAPSSRRETKRASLISLLFRRSGAPHPRASAGLIMVIAPRDAACPKG